MPADIADGFAPGEWEFTPSVAAVFDEHVRASVPFYDDIQDAVAEVADWLAPDGSTIVDLGASTGETLKRIVDRHPSRDYNLIAYDESLPMLEAAAAKLGPRPLDTRHCHIEAIDLNRRDGSTDAASLTLALFTLQFIAPEHRTPVLRRARMTSTDSGALIVAEKVRGTDARWSEIAAEASWDYKAANGVPSDSIRAKARALRGVLRPWSEAELFTAMRNAGWHNPTTLFRWHQWAVYGAFANE